MNPLSLENTLNINKILFFTQTSLDSNPQKDLIMYYDESKDSLSLKSIESEFYSQTINGMNILPAAGFQLSEHLNIKKESLPFKDCNIDFIGPFTLKSENFICLDFEKEKFFGICSNLDSLTPFYFIPLQTNKKEKKNEFAICTGEFCLKQTRSFNSLGDGEIEVVKVTNIRRFETEPGFLFKIWNHNGLFHYLNRKSIEERTSMKPTEDLNKRGFEGKTIDSFNDRLQNMVCLNEGKPGDRSEVFMDVKGNIVPLNKEARMDELPLDGVNSGYRNPSILGAYNLVNSGSAELQRTEEVLANKMNGIMKCNLLQNFDQMFSKRPFNPYTYNRDIGLQDTIAASHTPMPLHINQSSTMEMNPMTFQTPPIFPNTIQMNTNIPDPGILNYIDSLENKIQQQEVDINKLKDINRTPECCNSNSTNILNINPPESSFFTTKEFVNVPYPSSMPPVINTVYNTNNELGTTILPMTTYVKYLNVVGNKTLPVDEYDHVENSVPILIPRAKFLEHPRILPTHSKYINDFYDKIPDKGPLYNHNPVHITEIIDDSRYLF